VRAGAIALAAAALVAAGAAAAGDEPPRADAARLMNELMSGRVPIGTPFSLPDQHGRRVGPAQWRGRVVLLYFGYLFCPDVCPTDLRAIADAIESLGADGASVQPVFVTLDPERDSADMAGRYAEAFHPRFAALRGSDAETRRVAEAYKVFYEKVPLRSGGYAIDHTSFTYVLDGEGRYVGYFPPGTSGKRMADFVRSLLPAAKR
jgi:cytochrome oxidase Cu insertion factor (SCO1/SenC/PrrC family)